MSAPIEACGVCRFHQAETNSCRRNPPQVTVFPTNRNPETGAVELSAQSAFPTTDPANGWCGAFEPIRRIIQ